MMGTLIEIFLRKDEGAKCSFSLQCPGKKKLKWNFYLPWMDELEWNLAYSYLATYNHLKNTWPTDKKLVEKAEHEGWSNYGKPLDNRIRKIGKVLYDHIFNEDQHRLFNEALDESKQGVHQIARFTFASPDSFLLSYPWEILHDGDAFIFKNPDVTLVRTLALDKTPNNRKLKKSELKLLAVCPKHEDPQYYLEEEEITFIKETFFKEDGKGQLLGIANNYRQFLDYLANFQPTALHVDTHGDYGAPCPHCGTFLSIEKLKKGKYVICENPKCSHTINTNSIEPKGYILFTEEKKKLRWISGENLGDALSTKSIRLITLSICKSGQVGNGSAFNSIAGALLRRGFQAVIAMNYKVEQVSCAFFTKALYTGLLNNLSLPNAVANAKIAFHNVNDAWYRPTLYYQVRPDSIWEPLFQNPQNRNKSIRPVGVEQNQDFESNFSQYDINLLQTINNKKILNMEEFLRSSGRELLSKLGIVDSFNVLFTKEVTTSLLRNLELFDRKLQAFQSEVELADIESDHFFFDLLSIKKGLSKILEYKINKFIGASRDVRISTKAHVYQDNLERNLRDFKAFLKQFDNQKKQDSNCRIQIENLITKIRSDCSTFSQILNEVHRLAALEEKILLS